MVLAGFKKKLFTQIGIALGAILLLAIFIFLLNKDINTRIEAIEKAKGEIALREKTIELLTGTNTDFKRADPLFENLKSLLPNKIELIAFESSLLQRAKTFAVESGFKFGAEKAGTTEEPGTIKFTMTAAGSYEDIIDFLKYVEGHKYFISLDSIDINRSSPNKYSSLIFGEIFTQ